MISVHVMEHGTFASIHEHKTHANTTTAWGIFSTRTGRRFAGTLTIAPARVLRLVGGAS